MGESLVTDVMSCARCGFNHDHVAFLKLVRPMSDFQWWAECPITHEPILMKVEDDGQPVDGDSLCAMCGAKLPVRCMRIIAILESLVTLSVPTANGCIL